MNRTRSGKWLPRLFWLFLLLVAIGVAAVRWELAPVSAGLLVVTVGALGLTLFGVVLVPVILVRLAARKPVSGAAWGRCVLGLMPLAALLLSVGPSGFGAPAIHDITTDTREPPHFELAAAARQESDNDPAYAGEGVASAQREAYPDIEPLIVERSPQEALEVVRRSIDAMGWEMLGVREQDLAVEAVAHSTLFRFEDDVVVRVRPADGGSRIDIRSASRVGQGDLGANAERIRRYRKILQQMLESIPRGGA